MHYDEYIDNKDDDADDDGDDGNNQIIRKNRVQSRQKQKCSLGLFTRRP